jgi:tetratricopeptide (TPR) repeat protein
MASTGAEIHKLEGQLQAEPNNLAVLCQLAELYMSEGKVNRASPLVSRAIDLYKAVQLSAPQGVKVLDISIGLWKADKYSNKNQMRINCTAERKRLGQSCLEVAAIVKKLRDLKIHQPSLNLKLSYVKEGRGSFQEALTLLSEIISEQATDGIDFSYVIFKAAVLLKQLGENKQAIEYLEFLQDDLPITHGITKLHVVAFLILVYEQSGEKYKVFLPSCYKSLNTICSSMMIENSNKAMKRLKDIVTNANVMDNHELWELLAIQSMDRCEYVMAIQFFLQALHKAAANNVVTPSNGPVLHWLVEIYYLYNDLETANRNAEKAIALLPNNSDLRNLLLQINPEKWTERLRYLSATTATPEDRPPSPMKKVGTSVPTAVASGAGARASKQAAPVDGNESELDVDTAPKKKKIYQKQSEKDKDKDKEKEKDKDGNTQHGTSSAAVDASHKTAAPSGKTSKHNDSHHHHDDPHHKETSHKTSNKTKAKASTSSAATPAAAAPAPSSSSSKPGSASAGTTSKPSSAGGWVAKLKATATGALESITRVARAVSPPLKRPLSPFRMLGGPDGKGSRPSSPEGKGRPASAKPEKKKVSEIRAEEEAAVAELLARKLPSKPVKPSKPLTAEAQKMLRFALAGNNNVSFFSLFLRLYCSYGLRNNKRRFIFILNHYKS